MPSGFSEGVTALHDAERLRSAAEAVVASHDIRFEGGDERRLGAKGRRTRAAILRAARKSFVARGWADTTVGAIAERARVGTGTLYQYFRSKEELLAAIVGEWTLAALATMRRWDPIEGPEGLRALVDQFVREYAASVRFQAAWEELSLVEPRLAELRRDLTEVYVATFAEAFAAGAEAGLLDPGPDPVETARALCAMVDRYCHQVFVQRPGTITAEEASALLCDLWTAALRLP